MEFTDVPTRGNSQWIYASWFNYLRNAGIVLQNRLNAFVGAGASNAEGVFAIPNNQSAFADITGLIVSNLYRRTTIRYWVIRVATDTVMETGTLDVMYDGTNFYFGQEKFESPVSAGMTLDIDQTTGQAKFKSSNMAGTYNAGASKIGYSRTTQGTI